MGLLKEITDTTGFLATYWNVGYFNLDKTSGRVNFTMKGYQDKTAYDNHLESVKLEIEGAWPLDLEDPVISAYEKLNLRYNANGEKQLESKFVKVVGLADSFTADIEALKNQVLMGCYMTAKSMVEFDGALDD